MNRGMTHPIFEYKHSEGKSITGGYIYLGKKILKLRGKYIYGDFVSGKIWALARRGHRKFINEHLLDSNLPISSFAVDQMGEILVISLNGSIFRLAKK